MTMGAANTDEVTVLEHIQISPAPGVGDKSFPLSFLDFSWLLSPPVHRLCFYEFPLISKSHFTQTLVPNLKHSLSITLHHYFPFAGNLIVFPYVDPNHVPRKPEIRYVEGQDSVSLTVAECCAKDITYLAGNHARKAHEFYPLVPKLGDIGKDSPAHDYIKVPVLAIQVTLFPDRGICIGVTNHHAACDGKVGANFIKAWASITKFGNDTDFVAGGSLPVFDRSVIKDPNCLETVRWGEMSRTRVPESQPRHVNSINTTDDKVRASFILTRDQINKVKKSILGQAHGRTFSHLSSFTIVCGLVWACLTKERDAVGMYKQGDDHQVDEREQFVCAADCRARLDPPVPASYSGNCLVPCIVTVEDCSQLLGEEGVFNAIELIGGAIHKRFYCKESLFDGAELWGKEIAFGPPTVLGVSGSPKFNIYDADFGWGKPNKYEIVSIDYNGAMCLSESKESKDDIQIGLSLAKIQMDVFQDIFNKELNSLLLGD